MVLSQALQIAEKRREVKGKGEKERYMHLKAEFQRRARKPSQVNSAKKQRKAIEWERLEISSKKLRHQGNNSCKDGLNKGQKWQRPNRSKRYKEEVARIHRRTVQKRSS